MALFTSHVMLSERQNAREGADWMHLGKQAGVFEWVTSTRTSTQASTQASTRLGKQIMCCILYTAPVVSVYEMSLYPNLYPNLYPTSTHP